MHTSGNGNIRIVMGLLCLMYSIGTTDTATPATLTGIVVGVVVTTWGLIAFSNYTFPEQSE